jgi:hypothetical protein
MASNKSLPRVSIPCRSAERQMKRLPANVGISKCRVSREKVHDDPRRDSCIIPVIQVVNLLVPK